jgi:CDP-diglyceride synthetase
MKLIISTIVGAILFFLLGWLIYGVIFVNNFDSMKQIMRPESDMKHWALIVGNILQALILSYLYMKTYKGESPLKEGFLFGFATGALVCAPYIFYMWSSYRVTYRAVVADGILMFIMFLIVGTAIGLIFGKKVISETKEVTN